MEEEVKIKKIANIVDNDKSYLIDVDDNTTFFDFKKILSSAAHLQKNNFRIFLDQQEYTNDYDDNTIQELFQNIEPVTLHIFTNKDINEFEEELVSVSFNINVPCNDHIGKYKVFFCLNCNKSICMECLGQHHTNHKIEEKSDYLAPAKILMNKIFSNSSLFKADSKLSKYSDCITFRSNLKLKIFDDLRKLINDLEVQFASCLEYFCTCEAETETNTNENLELLKRFCVECYIKLKNDINTKRIMIDDQIFLTVYNKLKEIERYKNERFEENKHKYEKMNTLLGPFIQQVEKISDELRITVDNYLNKDLYEKFKLSIQENMVEKIQKEQVNDMMFRNLGVPIKSLNRNSLGVINTYRTGRNKYKSPDLMSERNPFQKASHIPQQQRTNNGAFIDYDSSRNAKNLTQNYTSYNGYELEEKEGGLPKMPENINFKGDKRNIINTKVVCTTTTTNINNMNASTTGEDRTNFGRRIEEIGNTNISGVNNLVDNEISNKSLMKSILNNNIATRNLNMNMNSFTESNINSNINELSTNTNIEGISTFDDVGNTQNIQKETTVYNNLKNSFPTKTTKYAQQEYNIQNRYSLPIMNETQINNNITKTITTTITDLNNKMGPQKRGITYSMNKNAIGTMKTYINSNINKSYSQGENEITQYAKTANQQQINQLGSQQGISISNLMNGEKLTDILNNEINKNELELQEKMKNLNIINEPTHSEHLYGNNGTNIQKVEKSQTIEYGNSLYSIFLFMSPIFNTNELIGALEDESTGKVVVNFKQAFGEKDIQLNEFPQGGAFCNNGPFLYFSGGQEKQKYIGKIFSKLSVSKIDLRVKLIKLPSMKYNHWNHTMIGNDDYIFALGGYNSNKCECFNLKTLKWEAMPDLNSEERQRPILAICKDYLYAFMGFTQYNILDSVERINIKKINTSKWEKVSITNPCNFYGAGVYNFNRKLYFVGGKIGKGNDETDYKSQICHFDFDSMAFYVDNIHYTGKFNFIENKFHQCNSENIGNFIDSNGGCLATISISSLIK